MSKTERSITIPFKDGTRELREDYLRFMQETIIKMMPHQIGAFEGDALEISDALISFVCNNLLETKLIPTKT